MASVPKLFGVSQGSSQFVDVYHDPQTLAPSTLLDGIDSLLNLLVKIRDVPIKRQQYVDATMTACRAQVKEMLRRHVEVYKDMTEEQVADTEASRTNCRSIGVCIGMLMGTNQCGLCHACYCRQCARRTSQRPR